MQINPAIAVAIEQVAWRYQADFQLLCTAIERESGSELAAVLGLAPAVADEHIERIRRAVTVQSDLGAGCKLLTDDVQAEVLAALAEL